MERKGTADVRARLSLSARDRVALPAASILVFYGMKSFSSLLPSFLTQKQHMDACKTTNFIALSSNIAQGIQ